MLAWVFSEPEWTDPLILIGVIVFLLGLLSMLTDKITVEYTFFLFLGMAFFAGGVLCQ